MLTAFSGEKCTVSIIANLFILLLLLLLQLTDLASWAPPCSPPPPNKLRMEYWIALDLVLDACYVILPYAVPNILRRIYFQSLCFCCAIHGFVIFQENPI